MLVGSIMVDALSSPKLMSVAHVRLDYHFRRKLHEYPQQDVIDGSGGGSAVVLDECLNQNGGVLQLLHRYAGRTFCTPGKRIRLDEESYYPDYMGGTGLDELWMCCTVPIVTGVIDTRTGKSLLLTAKSFRCRI